MGSSSSEKTVVLEDEPTRVLRWRHTQLVRGGFAPAAAMALAAQPEIDIHDALELVRNGCPPATALKILL